MKIRVTCLTLRSLQSDTIIEEKKLLEMISNRAEDLYYQGVVDFYEAVSVDSIKYALQWFLSEGVIVPKKVHTGSGNSKWSRPGNRLLQLQDQFGRKNTKSPSSKQEESTTEGLLAKINNYRKSIAPETLTDKTTSATASILFPRL
jgi:hypothetical protein